MPKNRGKETKNDTNSSIEEFTALDDFNHETKLSQTKLDEFNAHIANLSQLYDLSFTSLEKLHSECDQMTEYELNQLLSKKPPVGIRNRSNMCYFKVST